MDLGQGSQFVLWQTPKLHLLVNWYTCSVKLCRKQNYIIAHDLLKLCKSFTFKTSWNFRNWFLLHSERSSFCVHHLLYFILFYKSVL